MQTPTQHPLWHAFPALNAITDPHWQNLMSQARNIQLPAGSRVFQAGEPCQNFFFILEGTLRVIRYADNGREIVLYRVASGETCVLTTSCLLAGNAYPAEGITETAVRAVALPAAVFHDALILSGAFRAFVFAAFSERLADLITLIALKLYRLSASAY